VVRHGPASARSEAVRIGRLMYERQLVVAAEGNLSSRLAGGTFLITPTGLCKGQLQQSDLIEIDLRGRPVPAATPPAPSPSIVASAPDTDLNFRSQVSTREPSSEWPLHREIYQRRTDVVAICHGHPPWATAFAAAGQPLTGCLLPEIVATVGAVPLAAYGTPGTEEVPAAVRDLVTEHSALLLANHGVVTMGGSLSEAFQRLESVERLAQITLLARLAGGERRLTAEQAAALQKPGSGRRDVSSRLLCEPADSHLPAGSAALEDPAGFADSGQEAALEALADLLAREILAELAKEEES